MTLESGKGSTFTGKLIWNQDARQWELLTRTGVKSLNDLLDPFEEDVISVQITSTVKRSTHTDG